MTQSQISLAILGASGYTGLDALRLGLAHPRVRVAALSAHTRVDEDLSASFPALAGVPRLQKIDTIDWASCDAVVSALPHGRTAEHLMGLPKDLRIIDMSADFRLRKPEVYKEFYGREHAAPALLADAVYGLSEWNRDAIAKARLVACPGCYPTASLLVLLPLLQAGVIASEDIIIDGKVAVSGAGRGASVERLFSEVNEGTTPYAIGRHRHVSEMEQEMAAVVGGEVRVNFTPHLVPMNRGEMMTLYAPLAASSKVKDVRAALANYYKGACFVRVLAKGAVASTHQVRGSNYCMISVHEDRLQNRVILVVALDNLVKGSAGQALQNLNLMFGFAEDEGLAQKPLFP